MNDFGQALSAPVQFSASVTGAFGGVIPTFPIVASLITLRTFFKGRSDRSLLSNCLAIARVPLNVPFRSYQKSM